MPTITFRKKESRWGPETIEQAHLEVKTGVNLPWLAFRKEPFSTSALKIREKSYFWLFCVPLHATPKLPHSKIGKKQTTDVGGPIMGACIIAARAPLALARRFAVRRTHI